MNKQQIEKQIKKFQQMLLDAEKPKLVPTGNYVLELTDEKGELITSYVRPDRDRAVQLRNDIYKLAIQNLKAKVHMSLKREMKVVKE